MTTMYTIPLVAKKSPSPFRFPTFYTLYNKHFPKTNAPSQSFLEWFVGFTEGNGSFKFNSRGIAIFVISLDQQVLEYIQRTLGFGRINKQGLRRLRRPCTSCFIVEELASVALLVALFNGNMVLPIKQSSFALFLKAFNKRSRRSQDVGFIPSLVSPTIYDFWLSGITDADGCFNCSLLGNSKAYRIRFFLGELLGEGEDNLTVLKHITTLIGGVVRTHSNPGRHELIINGVRNVERILKYFETHPLYTQKAKSYQLWREVQASLLKGEHLSPASRAVLKSQAASINKKNECTTQRE
uniref:LAGLIDADG endonuclease n=1 Tax=Lyophyllum shimeji TaxID=47721 RepID=A0A2Z4HGZ3_LYOSH|nr:LAGLIDADG endonuclease [Lyophyllum shimeji]AWW14100.1 LAGLIDADG endonuclease [Lyophyllum shimeji]